MTENRENLGNGSAAPDENPTDARTTPPTSAPVESETNGTSAPDTATTNATDRLANTAQTPSSTYAPPTSNYAPPTQTHPPTQPAPHWQNTLPHNGSAAPGASFGAAGVAPGAYGPPNFAGQAPASAKDAGARRGSKVGIIAALAIGALVGGVSGAGVAAFSISANQSSAGSVGAAAPTNITVNDPANATTITAVAAATGPSVVTISVSDASAQAGGTGSGVILTDDGYILTNTHVVTLDGASGAPTISVQTSDGHLYSAKLVGTDPISDLAVVKVDAGSIFQPAEFADSSKLNVGDTAIAIGAPLGLANTVTNGIVSSLNRSITVASSAAPSTPEAPDSNNNGTQGPFDFWQYGQDPGAQTQASATIALTVIQTDAAINPGNSGGALLDSEGKVIGINVAIASAGASNGSSQSGSIGVGFAIPANLAKRIANEIMDTGTGTHGLLGATVSDVGTDSTVVGASIQSVSPSGAAEAGGLRSGDVVTSINGIPVTGKNDLTAQVRALAAGADATIVYQRGGSKATTTVTLGSLG